MSDSPCPCWARTTALGHDGHCCFQVDGKWRPDEEVCHDPQQLDLLNALEDA